MHSHPHPVRLNIEACWTCGEKIAATSRQTPKNVTTAKSSRIQLPTCGRIKTATFTQRDKGLKELQEQKLCLHVEYSSTNQQPKPDANTKKKAVAKPAGR